ncbi:MAG: hypothetical protein U0X41_12545 [Chitinophagales bacterium]
MILPFYMVCNYMYYYKVRIANSDDCFPFYNIVEHNVIDMLHFRFLQGLYSIPPIAMNVLGADVKWIAVCYAFVYSVPVLFTMYLLYRTSWRYFVYFMLSFTFFISYQYYFSISEYWLGGCIYFILYMLMDRGMPIGAKGRWLHVILLLLTVNLHLSLFYPTVVMLLYLFLKAKLDMKTTGIYLVVCFLYLLLKLTFLTTEYESDILTDNNQLSLADNYLNTRVIREFFLHSWDWLYPAVVLAFIAYSVFKGQIEYHKSILLSIFVIVPLFVVALMFKNFPYFFYVIGNLRVLLLFLPILFVDFCPKKLYKPIVILLIIHAIFSIESIGITLKKRYDNIAELLTATKENTVYVYDDPVCLVHFKYIFMQTMTINLLENDKNNYISFINPKTDNIDYLKHDLVKYQSISKKEYKNRFTEYKMQKLSETRYAIYDFLIDRNVRECILDR